MNAIELADKWDSNNACDGDYQKLADEMATELRRLHAENEALKKDAARYQGLKKLTYAVNSDIRVEEWNESEGYWEKPADWKFDIVVDAAMEQSK